VLNIRSDWPSTPRSRYCSDTIQRARFRGVRSSIERRIEIAPTLSVTFGS
jgi:hypothetical protein